MNQCELKNTIRDAIERNLRYGDEPVVILITPNYVIKNDMHNGKRSDQIQHQEIVKVTKNLIERFGGKSPRRSIENINKISDGIISELEVEEMKTKGKEKNPNPTAPPPVPIGVRT